jgi:hypothetical protein
MLIIINSILGGALLVAGRRLFWLFVGASGFILGFQLTTRFFNGNEAIGILVGLGVGVLFGFLAVALQSVAIFVAGFLSGAYIASAAGIMFGLERGPSTWILYVTGGIIGLILVGFLFDWALITLSSLAGASLIAEVFITRQGLASLTFFVLFIAGVLIQRTTLRNEKQTPQSGPPA